MLCFRHKSAVCNAVTESKLRAEQSEAGRGFDGSEINGGGISRWLRIARACSFDSTRAPPQMGEPRTPIPLPGWEPYLLMRPSSLPPSSPSSQALSRSPHTKLPSVRTFFLCRREDDHHLLVRNTTTAQTQTNSITNTSTSPTPKLQRRAQITFIKSLRSQQPQSTLAV